MRSPSRPFASVTLIWLATIIGASGQLPSHTQTTVSAPSDPGPGGSINNPRSSAEQGQTPLTDSFESLREWRVEKRREAFRDTEFRFNIRTFYLDRDKFDDSDSQALAIGGWAGVKTGYFLDHVSFGMTGYTSQKILGDKNKDGTLLLATGQEGYSVLGEAYVDIRVIDDLNLYVGRKEFDSPYINRNDTRMTPNTFELILLEGKAKFGNDGGTLKYGAGYFEGIKERNSDEFVSMSEDAGANVERGVYTAGAVFEKGNLSVGAIDYYSPDIINIGYAETKLTVPVGEGWKPKFSAQFTDQRSVGDNYLQDDNFSVQQFGIKVDVPVKQALFTLAYTYTTDGADMRSPWSGYPGYTSVQVQDFNRAGEGALLARASYEFTTIKGLSTYALAVFGSSPSEIGQYRQTEYDANLQWAPPEGVLKGLSVRLRYGVVHQEGGDFDNLRDFRVICNYAITF